MTENKVINDSKDITCTTFGQKWSPQMLLRSYKYQQPMSTACYNKTNFTNYVKNTGF